ncbi:MAG: ATP-binding protein [Thermodesulfobacteriota bacterium]
MVTVLIASDLDVFTARRAGRQMAEEVGFNSSDCALLEIVVSELATNIVKYAVKGTISLENIPGGVEIISEDCGRGIENIEQALNPGKSSRGLGLGLNGVKRMMDHLEIVSAKEKGTRIIARKWRADIPYPVRPKQEYGVPTGGLMKYGVISIPALGSELNGDAYVIKEFQNKALIAVLDGLGHGHNAYMVVQQAVDYIQRNYSDDIAAIIEGCHEVLRRTRGMVMRLTRIDFEEEKLTTAGVGNVDIKVDGKNQVRAVATRGIVGHNLGRLLIQDFPYSKGDTIFIYSDGVSGRFDPKIFELRGMEPPEIAGVVFRRFGKDLDDATIVVAREPE